MFQRENTFSLKLLVEPRVSSLRRNRKSHVLQPGKQLFFEILLFQLGTK